MLPTSSRSPGCRIFCRRPPIPRGRYTVNTIAEHLDMLMVCHHLNPHGAGGRRVRREPHPAGDHRGRRYPARSGRHQHDVERFAGHGPHRRSGDAHLADRAQDEGAARARLPGDSSRNDNLRVKRYVAKYTINPAITHGIAREVGSIEPGKLADLVLWNPAFFGVKPEMVIKGGFIAWSVMGDANASIPTPQPVLYRPMFGSFGGAPQSTGVTFVSQASLAHVERLGLQQAPGGGAELPQDRQGGHDSQLGDAAHRGGSGNVRSSRRWRTADLRAGQRSAAGATIFSVLEVY